MSDAVSQVSQLFQAFAGWNDPDAGRTERRTSYEQYFSNVRGALIRKSDAGRRVPPPPHARRRSWPTDGSL